MSGTRRKPGRMGPFIAGLQARWSELGYSDLAIRNMLKDVGAVGRWMQERNVQPGDLSPALLGDFRRYRIAVGVRKVSSIKSFQPMLAYLREQGVVVERPRSDDPLQRLLDSYRCWLIDERGLAQATVIRYENLARRFLTLHPLEAGTTVSGAEVVAFLLQESRRVSVGSAKGRVAELRSLLRFLFVRQLTPRLLTTAIPPVAGWRDTGIPKALPAGYVQQLLDRCDRSDPVQVRDFAILMLVARLGLRSIEVARMQLDGGVRSSV